MLAQQSLADGDGVELADVGADRQPVDWRGADDGQFAHARQAHLQGPGDRRGGQGQDVDVRAHLLEPLFVLHAKMLLFVDHQQAKVLEPDGLGEQRVGANDDVDRSIGNTVAGQGRIFCTHKTRQGSDIDGKSAKSFSKALVVLTR